MAKVTVCVLGGQPQNIIANTVGDVKRKLGLENHTASVNGSPKGNDQELTDYQYISLAPSVKGGLN